MKKLIALMLALSTAVTLFAACGEIENTTVTTLTKSNIVGSWAYVSENEQNVFNFYEDGTLLNQVYLLDCYSQENKGKFSHDETNATITLDKLDVDATYSFDEHNNLVLTFDNQSYTYNRIKPFTTDQYKEENGYFTGLWADIPTPVSLFKDSHFADTSYAYNYNIKESAPKKADYGVNYNYFFDNEEDAQEAFSKYYTYLLEDKFTLPKDSEILEKKIKKMKFDRDVEKESEFEISRNILVNRYTGEEIGVGLCYDSNEKRIVLSVTLFNDEYDPDDYAKDRKIKINYTYKNVVVTKHRSNINPADYHIVSREVIIGGNNPGTPSKQPTSSVDNTPAGADTTPSNTVIGDTVEDVKVTKKELSAEFKTEAEGAQKSESIEDHTPMDTEAHVISVNLSETNFNLEMGTKKTISATVMPSEGVDTGIMWSSNNETVAIVDKDGNVYGMSPGVATITAASYDTATGITREATVIVYANEGNKTESDNLINLINNERSANGASALSNLIENASRPQDSEKLFYLANQRAYEEAYENDGKMDTTRPDGSDHSSIYKLYDLSTKADTTFCIWGKNYDANTVFEKLKGTDIGNLLATSASYRSIGAGYFKDEASGVAFWSITLVSVA